MRTKTFFQTLLFLTLILLFGRPVQASHFAGAEVTYSCVNACTTEVQVQYYRYCNGLTVSGGAVNFVATMPGCTLPQQVGVASATTLLDVTPVCPSVVTTCTVPSSSIQGIIECTTTYQYDLCAASQCVYRLTWYECCRSVQINSLANPGGVGFLLNNTVNNALGSCNSGPEFTNIPFLYACQGTDYDIDLGGQDPDGDSLSYALGPCYSAPLATTVTYAPGFSSNAPLGASWNVSLDPVTGMMHLDAAPGNLLMAVICVAVTEYRNGVAIGTHQRDIQFLSMNCPSNDLPSFTGITNLSSGTVVGDDIYICSSTPLCFDIGSADINAGQSLRMYWNQNLAGGTFSQVGNPSVIDTITGTSAMPPVGQLCWTPPGPGVYQVRFRVGDDACPIQAFSDKVITIHVANNYLSAAIATPMVCLSASFEAFTCGAGPFTYAWSGAGGLSGTTAAISHVYPSSGSWPWQVIVGNGLSSDTVSGLVIVGTTPSQATLLSGIHAVAPCSGTTYDTLIGPVGYSSYLWSTGATTQDLIVSIGGNYGLTVTDASGCLFTDQVTVNWTAPDIYGIVSTSTGQALQNQKIYLIEYDHWGQALNAIDSIWTDSSGYYFFCNITDTFCFLKAAPRSGDYPNEMPTYADLSLFWNSARSFMLLGMSPFQFNFSTLSGINPGGPGFIGGLISQGANKTAGVGDPMPNVRIFLRDKNTGDVFGYRDTDANGYFRFNNLPMGDFEFAVDVPGVDELNVPQLTLDAQNPNYDSLDFRLHSTYLELYIPTVAIANADLGFSYQLAPNPFGNQTRLSLKLDAGSEIEIEILDGLGRRLRIFEKAYLEEGEYVYEIGEGLPNGIYFVSLKLNGSAKVIRALKLD